jgi:hypothetical protein
MPEEYEAEFTLDTLRVQRELLNETSQMINSFGTLRFVLQPREGTVYSPLSDEDILRYNAGAHVLVENVHANQDFLQAESFLCNLLVRLSRPRTRGNDHYHENLLDQLQDDAYDALCLLRRQKEIDWSNQRDKKRVVDTGL